MTKRNSPERKEMLAERRRRQLARKPTTTPIDTKKLIKKGWATKRIGWTTSDVWKELCTLIGESEFYVTRYNTAVSGGAIQGELLISPVGIERLAAAKIDLQKTESSVVPIAENGLVPVAAKEVAAAIATRDTGVLVIA